jgi:starvation-inducible outer membrane lipoprotein
MRQHNLAWLAAALCVALAACGEKPQTLSADTKKPDAKSWEASNSPYLAQGWKAGDKTSWDEQMRTRAQAQNEYVRTK